MKKLERWINPAVLFMRYRYKKPTTNVTGEPKPWIPVAERSNHEYALEFRDWKKIIVTYFDILVENLIEGHIIRLPKGIGSLELVRIKLKSRVTTREGTRFFRNLHTMGFKPRLVWNRYTEGTLKLRMLYMFNLMPTQWKRISDSIMKEPDIIFKYPDISTKHV